MFVYGTLTSGDGFGGHTEMHLGTFEDGRLAFFTEGSASGGDVRLYSSSADPRVDDGRWHQAVVTWQRGSTATLYLDGRQIGTVPHNANEFVAAKVRIGRPAANSFSRFLNGSLDDVRFYDRVLSAAEVAEAFPAGVALTAHYRFDGDLRDASPGSTEDAIPVGSSGLSTDGYRGGGLIMDGTGGGAVLPDRAGMSLFDSQQGSVSLWVRAEATGRHQMLAYGTTTTGDGYGPHEEIHLTLLPDGRALFFVENSAQGDDFRLPQPSSSSVRLNDGRWHHVAVT